MNEFRYYILYCNLTLHVNTQSNCTLNALIEFAANHKTYLTFTEWYSYLTGSRVANKINLEWKATNFRILGTIVLFNVTISTSRRRSQWNLTDTLAHEDKYKRCVQYYEVGIQV